MGLWRKLCLWKGGHAKWVIAFEPGRHLISYRCEGCSTIILTAELPRAFMNTIQPHAPSASFDFAPDSRLFPVWHIPYVSVSYRVIRELAGVSLYSTCFQDLIWRGEIVKKRFFSARHVLIYFTLFSRRSSFYSTHISLKWLTFLEHRGCYIAGENKLVTYFGPSWFQEDKIELYCIYYKVFYLPDLS